MKERKKVKYSTKNMYILPTKVQYYCFESDSLKNKFRGARVLALIRSLPFCGKLSDSKKEFCNILCNSINSKPKTQIEQIIYVRT